MMHRLQQGDGGQAGDARLLLALARDQSTAGRRGLAFSMADLFGAGGGISQRSRELAAQILDRLIRDFETDLRRALAERLASKPDVPRALILLLANDAIEVARPVLLESEVLLPDDLLDIIERRGADHQLAIAMRRSLTETVCLALVATDNVAVIEALLKNECAPIPQRTLDYLVEEAHWVEAYCEPLVQRQELRPPLARRLYALVSAALRAHILEHFDIDPEALDDELEPLVAARAGTTASPPASPPAAPAGQGAGPAAPSTAALSAVEPAVGRTSHPAASEVAGGQASEQQAVQTGTAGTADQAAEALEASPGPAAPDWQEVTPELLITLLRRGDRGQFEQCFAQLSGLRAPRLERVLYGAEGKELAVACRGLGIDKKAFAVIVFLCRQGAPQIVPGTEVDDPRAVAQVIDYFDQMEPAAALVRLRRWRRNPDYVAAIEELETRAEKRQERRDDL